MQSHISLHFPEFCLLTCLACPPLRYALQNENKTRKKSSLKLHSNLCCTCFFERKTYFLPLMEVVAEYIRYSVKLMATFQELVISLWASVGWNLNGWNVRVICNMFQLSGEQHTWGNERGCGAIRHWNRQHNERLHSSKKAKSSWMIHGPARALGRCREVC